MELSDIKDFVPVLSVAIGAMATLIAVAVTSFFNFKLAKLNLDAQRQHKLEELKLEKLEELFFLFDKWQINFSNVYLCHLRCYKGKLSFREVLDTVNGFTSLAPGEAQKYKMILDIYFPSLRTAYSPVEAARRKVVPFLSDPNVSKLNDQDFMNAQVAFEKACEEFKSCISSLVPTLCG